MLARRRSRIEPPARVHHRAARPSDQRIQFVTEPLHPAVSPRQLRLEKSRNLYDCHFRIVRNVLSPTKEWPLMRSGQLWAVTAALGPLGGWDGDPPQRDTTPGREDKRRQIADVRIRRDPDGGFQRINA